MPSIYPSTLPRSAQLPTAPDPLLDLIPDWAITTALSSVSSEPVTRPSAMHSLRPPEREALACFLTCRPLSLKRLLSSPAAAAAFYSCFFFFPCVCFVIFVSALVLFCSWDRCFLFLLVNYFFPAPPRSAFTPPRCVYTYKSTIVMILFFAYT